MINLLISSVCQPFLLVNGSHSFISPSLVSNNPSTDDVTKACCILFSRAGVSACYRKEATCSECRTLLSEMSSSQQLQGRSYKVRVKMYRNWRGLPSSSPSQCSIPFIPATLPPFDVRGALMCHRLPSERASESRAQSCVDKSQWDVCME